MDKIVIAGGKPLRGRIRISGAKNASLAILCATFLSRNEVVLENVPDISDVRVMVRSSKPRQTYWENTEALGLNLPQSKYGAPTSWLNAAGLQSPPWSDPGPVRTGPGGLAGWLQYRHPAHGFAL